MSIMMPGVVAYKLADQKGASGLERFRERPDIQQEIERFKTGLRDIKTVDDFFKNDRVYRFVLEGANLAADIPYRGKVQRILSQDHEDKESLMNKLTDDRFKKLAEKLRFAESGVERMKTSATMNQLIDDFVKARYEQSLGEQNPAVPLARYFRDNVGDIKSEYTILGDAKMREVVLTALGLPMQIAVQPVESQAEAIKKRLDLKDLQNPQFLEKFIQRYLINKDLEASRANGFGGGDSYILSLFGRPGGNGFNFNILV